MPDLFIPTFEQEPPKVYPTYAMFGAATLELHEMVLQWEREHDMQFTRIVGAPRGALGMMLHMSQLMDIPGDHVVQAVSNGYDENNERTLDAPTYIPEPRLVAEQHCLIVDDVSESGTCEANISKALQEAGAASVTTLDWYYKPGLNTSGKAPDIYLEKTDDWIEFPWEMYKHYTDARNQLVMQGASAADLEQLKINFKTSQGTI